jgi:hypothetical protein
LKLIFGDERGKAFHARRRLSEGAKERKEFDFAPLPLGVRYFDFYTLSAVPTNGGRLPESPLALHVGLCNHTQFAGYLKTLPATFPRRRTRSLALGGTCEQAFRALQFGATP